MEDGERKPETEAGESPVPGAQPGDEGEAAGVFGSLPRSRPGRRSPRRAPVTAPAPVPDEPAERPPESLEPEPEVRADAPADQETEPDRARSPAGQGGLEELAWAGIAIAAEAATLGLRLANRALEAMRGDAERP